MVAIFFSNLLKENRKTATLAPFHQSCSQPEKALEGKETPETDVACCCLQQIPLPLSKQNPVPGEKLRRVEVLVLAVGCRLLAGGSWLLVAVAGCLFSTENENDVTVCHD